MVLGAETSTGTSLIGPMVAASASIIVAVVSAIWSARTSRDAQQCSATATAEVEKLKADLATETAERSARRDYEYEARKRLYETCEPLLFQLMERSFDAHHRILNLAGAARRGDVQKGQGWFAEPATEYYPMSTVYRLMTPMVLFRLLQENLTTVDLRLDACIGRQYSMARLLAWSFTDAHDLARMADLQYDPYANVGWPEYRRRRAEQPQVSWRQGLATARLDNAIEEMIVRSGDRGQVISYGQFVSLFVDNESKLRKSMDQIVDVFDHFHPATRPVFWLVLIVHEHLYRALLQSADMSTEGKSREFLVNDFSIPRAERVELDWRRDKAEASDDEVLTRPFEVAEQYVQSRMQSSFGRTW